jgi:hypothetical protein
MAHGRPPNRRRGRIKSSFRAHNAQHFFLAIQKIVQNKHNTELKAAKAATKAAMIANGEASRFTGVYPIKNSKQWRASIKINQKLQHLGCFDTDVLAARAYDNAAKQNPTPSRERKLNFSNELAPAPVPHPPPAAAPQAKPLEDESMARDTGNKRRRLVEPAAVEPERDQSTTRTGSRRR